MFASRLRIAVVAHHVAPIRPPFVGGVESSTWYLARWLARAGVVHLQSLHYLPVAMSQLLGVPTALTLHTPPTPWLEARCSPAAGRACTSTRSRRRPLACGARPRP